jgi:hypothetical protein
MDEIKIRIQLNKGRIGIPLDKLGNIANETLKFLKLMVRDVGISSPEGNWIAQNFENGSLSYDNIYSKICEKEQISQFNKGMEDVTSLGQGIIISNGFVSNETLLQYTNIAKYIEVDEKIEFGLYTNGDGLPKEWKELTRKKADIIIQKIQTNVEYYGSVYGSMYSLVKGAKPPFFILRDFLTGDLIHCDYDKDYYTDVVNALKKQTSTIYVHGRVRANIISKKIDFISVNNIKIAPELSDEEYNSFFGCAPDIKPIKEDNFYG